MVAMFSAAAALGSRYQAGGRTLRSMGLADNMPGGVPAAKNGGRAAGRSNMANKRAATKKRNQVRHRAACRG